MAERGEVIIQTFMPGHYAIRRAIAHDQIGFYEQELHMREMLRFPPYWRLLLARLEGLDAKQVAQLTNAAGDDSEGCAGKVGCLPESDCPGAGRHALLRRSKIKRVGKF